VVPARTHLAELPRRVGLPNTRGPALLALPRQPKSSGTRTALPACPAAHSACMGARLEREVADGAGPEHAVRHKADRGLRGREVQVGGERRESAVMAGVVVAHHRCCPACARLAACAAGFWAEVKKTKMRQIQRYWESGLCSSIGSMLRGFLHTSPWCSPDILLEISARAGTTGCSLMHAVIRFLSGPFPQLVLSVLCRSPEVRKT
jgi:hypothetical protein